MLLLDIGMAMGKKNYAILLGPHKTDHALSVQLRLSNALVKMSPSLETAFCLARV